MLSQPPYGHDGQLLAAFDLDAVVGVLEQPDHLAVVLACSPKSDATRRNRQNQQRPASTKHQAGRIAWPPKKKTFYWGDAFLK